LSALSLGKPSGEPKIHHKTGAIPGQPGMSIILLPECTWAAGVGRPLVVAANAANAMKRANKLAAMRRAVRALISERNPRRFVMKVFIGRSHLAAPQPHAVMMDLLSAK